MAEIPSNSERCGKPALYRAWLHQHQHSIDPDYALLYGEQRSPQVWVEWRYDRSRKTDWVGRVGPPCEFPHTPDRAGADYCEDCITKIVW